LLITVFTTSASSSIDFVNLHKAGPSTVAALLESQAGKQLPTFWETKHSLQISVLRDMTPCSPVEIY
jgi:hypothetical protein